MEIITEDTLNNTEGKVAVTVYITKGEQVAVTNVKKSKPNYFMIGNGTMNRQKIYGIDLLRELANSSKAGQFLLLAIKDGIGYDNNYGYVVKVIGTTSTEQKYLKLGYKELFERDLVRRVKRSHYMINPNALIPLDYDEALQVWEGLSPRD